MSNTQSTGRWSYFGWQDAVLEAHASGQIRDSAVVVLLWLRRYGDSDTGLNCRPTVETLATSANVSLSVVERALREARAAGLICQVVRGRRGTASVYRLTIPNPSALTGSPLQPVSQPVRKPVRRDGPPHLPHQPPAAAVPEVRDQQQQKPKERRRDDGWSSPSRQGSLSAVLGDSNDLDLTSFSGWGRSSNTKGWTA